MNQFEYYCKLFPSFTPIYCLFKAYWGQMEKQNVTDSINYLKSGIKMAQQFGNKLVTGGIQVSLCSLELVCNCLILG